MQTGPQWDTGVGVGRMEEMGESGGGWSWGFVLSIQYQRCPEIAAPSGKSQLPGSQPPHCQVKTCLSGLAGNYLKQLMQRERRQQKCPMTCV